MSYNIIWDEGECEYKVLHENLSFDADLRAGTLHWLTKSWVDDHVVRIRVSSSPGYSEACARAKQIRTNCTGRWFWRNLPFVRT